MLRRIIFPLLLCFSSAHALAQAAKPIQLAENAPDRYTVQRGDTLWGISGKFLREPWRWPEIWRLNRDQIRNPHRIYPGQVIVLDRAGPTLSIEKVQPKIYEEKGDEAIPAIPQQVIAPFLSEPLVVEEGALDNAPKIVATQEDRVFVGVGNTAYATGIKGNANLWQVYRKTKPIKDPVTAEVLGHEAFYLGSARVVRPGDPATMEIVTSKQEIGLTDRLIPAATPDVVTYAPHAPNKQVEGRVVSIYEGVSETGRNYIVSINRGKRDGMEIGHVLAIYRHGRNVSYAEDKASGRKEFYQLPDERHGLVFIFRTFERLSYGLVMNASRPVTAADIVRTP